MQASFQFTTGATDGSAQRPFRRAAALLVCSVMLAACNGSDSAPPPTVSIPYTNGAAPLSNPVAYWNKVAVDTINLPGTPGTGTPWEQRPVVQIELATVHIAIYDAVIAIAGTHRPFATIPMAATSGASQEAAAAAAAYGVLSGMFPNRSAQYQGAYDTYVASLPSTEAKTRGLAVGAEVAARTLALRANDGRATAPAYVASTAPGKFRGAAPVGWFIPSVRPFTLISAAQFRPEPPPALDSAQYAADFEEVRLLGGAASTARTAEQLEAARAHSESPATYPTRNYRQFAVDGASVADNARLLAMLWVAIADSAIGCFEAKFHYNFWRPLSAIPLADTDGNAQTAPDAAWTPVLPTPNHPEYPSAHMCSNSAAAIALKAFYGTATIGFTFSNTVTGNVRSYASPDELVAEINLARITGGMHFRTANVEGGALGTAAGQWVVANHFGRIH